MCLVYPVCGRVAVSTRGALGAQAVRLGFGKVDTCGWVGVQMGRCADGSAFGLVGLRPCVVWCWVLHVNCGRKGEQSYVGLGVCTHGLMEVRSSIDVRIWSAFGRVGGRMGKPSNGSECGWVVCCVNMCMLWT